MNIIDFQPEFRPALPCVFGPKDYQEFRTILIEMDRILDISGIEDRFIRKLIAETNRALSGRQFARRYRYLALALRHGILLAITGLSYRALAQRIADSQLFQWFTRTSFIDAVRPMSKSTIERFEKCFPQEALSDLIHNLNRAVADATSAEQLLYRETELRFDEIFADTTCVKSPIHFPVDWVLLRDATRTLIRAIILIRKHGLKHRIGPPEQFARQMNKLCIEMTHTRKKKDGKKVRKAVFRRMKTLTRTIEQHAKNYHALLRERWMESDWSELEAKVVLDRMQNILEQLPLAVAQAHERIIGERRIKNADKILSLYEPDAHVLVRGKSGAEVEFGNGLYLAEQSDGLIVDWYFMKGQPEADSKLVKPSLKRIHSEYGATTSYTTDRGFDAPENQRALEKLEIINNICPRSVPRMQEKLEDPVFCRLQKRRGATEGRIGIFKNAYLGTPFRSKGYEHRALRITWCILGHNLWKLATMAAQQKKELEDLAEVA